MAKANILDRLEGNFKPSSKNLVKAKEQKVQRPRWQTVESVELARQRRKEDDAYLALKETNKDLYNYKKKMVM